MSLWIPQVIINTVNQERGKGYTTGKNINGHKRDKEGYCNVLCDKLLYPSTPRVNACMLL